MDDDNDDEQRKTVRMKAAVRWIHFAKTRPTSFRPGLPIEKVLQMGEFKTDITRSDMMRGVEQIGLLIAGSPNAPIELKTDFPRQIHEGHVFHLHEMAAEMDSGNRRAGERLSISS